MKEKKRSAVLVLSGGSEWCQLCDDYLGRKAKLEIRTSDVDNDMNAVYGTICMGCAVCIQRRALP